MRKHTAILLAAALAIRLIGLNASSLWFDEAISKYRATLPLDLYVIDMADFVGANLWEIMLRPFAAGPVWLFRVPSLIAALVGIWLAWRITHRLQFTHTQQITATIPMLLLPGLIWMAQDARYYAAISVFYMAAIYFGISHRPLGLLAFTGLLPYLHPVAAFYGLAALAVAWISGMRFKRVCIVGGLTLVAWLPRIYSLVRPAHTRPSFWLTQITPEYFMQQTAQAFAVGTLGATAALVLLLVLAFVIVAAVLRIRESSTRVLLAAVLLPIAGMLAAGVLQPVFFYRPAQPILLPACLLVGLTLAPGPSWRSRIAPAVGALVLVAAVMNWNPAARGGYIDAGAAFVADHWRAGDRITYAAVTVAVPFRYYMPDVESCLIADNGLDVLPASMTDLRYCDPGELGPWLIWPREEIMDAGLIAQLTEITAGRMPVWRSESAWQSAPIEIYYLRPAGP